MQPSKDEIKAWLKNTQRSREWLASQFGDTKKKTVDNWLSSNQDIPIGILTSIGRMMDDDRRSEDVRIREVPGDQQIFSIQVDLQTFRTYNRAAVAQRLTLEEWVIKTCDEEVVRMTPGEEKKIVPMIVAEAPAALTNYGTRRTGGGHWIDLVGGVAAGAPISSHIVEAPVEVEKEYPEGCYALRVFGDSMARKIPDGSIVVVQPWDRARTPKKGTIVVYSDASGSTLKEFGYRKAKAGEDADAMGNVPALRSLNPLYKEVQTMEGGRIDAVLVEVV
ncbi:LexA family protein [Luteolibacter luteus]|uniref:S24 family peptidase n=1 Tax=Luteolibacter luteus TaxID=2728835 RepID=A0A858RNT1_9BACT|nr:S24 family peptidase [Luteolibacter luteus]QJE99096.1 S24 family peptidase [Luteolibacter luteus]